MNLKDSVSTQFSTVGVIVNTKIRNKIVILVVAICLFPLLSMSITSYITIKKMTEYTAQTNAALGKSAAIDASDALMSQAHQFLQIIAHGQSRSCDSLLNTIKFDVELIEGSVRDIFNNPQYHTFSRPVINISESVIGVHNSIYLLPANVTLTPEIQQELNMLSNLGLLMPMLSRNPNIINMYVGMESGLFYNYTQLAFEYLEFDPRIRPWYVEAVANSGKVVLTDLYEDVTGIGMTITAAKAIYDDNGNLIGVAALDILQENLKKLIVGTQITEYGYAFIIDSEGEYIVYPNIGSNTFDIKAQGTNGGTAGGLADGYIRMMNGETGYIADELDGKRFFMTFSPVHEADWSVGVFVYEDDLLTSLKVLSAQMTELTDEAEANISIMSGNAMVSFIIIFIAVVLMVVYLSIRLTHMVSKPIHKLTEEVIKMGKGNFEYRIPVETQDEIGFLTQSFNEMADNLYKYAQDNITLNQTKSELELLSNTDALTGILNRRCFLETSEKLINCVIKANKTAYIVIFDIDHFKQVNDTYGHMAGDAVLKEISSQVSSIIRPNDLFARYGGEEFVLLITDINESGICNLVERIRQDICRNPTVFEGASIPISASFGIAPVVSETEIEKAIALADGAMYKAKKEGRNQVILSI